MNGITFANLPQLAIVDLFRNVCINKLFEVELGSSKFRRKISRSCSSADFMRKSISCTFSIICDGIREEKFIRAYGNNLGCCELEYGIHIDEPDYTFDTNTNYTQLEVLMIAHQQNVEFLPILVHESFPIIKVYWIVNTPIQKISKINFEKLYELKVLKLDRNQIEVIKSDTFSDLKNLHIIIVCK